MTEINKERVQLWVDALRSGEYRQTRGYLTVQHIVDDETVTEHCCLGVACEVAISNGLELSRNSDETTVTYGGHEEDQHLPIEVQQWLGLSGMDPEVTRETANGFESTELTACNDTHLMSFSDIADAIEATYLQKEQQ